jgi:hypothetical protein
MKRIFLILAVSGYYAASAQQKDILDIQQYLEKKNKKLQTDFKKYLAPPVSFTASGTFILPKADKSYLLPNGDKVVYGNGTMPVVTTDLDQFQVMPNMKKDNELHLLPFPRLPEMIPNYIYPLKGKTK